MQLWRIFRFFIKQCWVMQQSAVKLFSIQWQTKFTNQLKLWHINSIEIMISFFVRINSLFLLISSSISRTFVWAISLIAFGYFVCFTFFSFFFLLISQIDSRRIQQIQQNSAESQGHIMDRRISSDKTRWSGGRVETNLFIYWVQVGQSK